MAGLGKTVVATALLLLVVHGIWMGWKKAGEDTKLVFTPAQTSPSVYPLGQQKVALPFTFPGTKLTAQALAMYEGPFAEDGSEDAVTNVAALILHNAGETGIAYAEVELMLEDRQYRFTVTSLPPGGKVLVPETSRQPFQQSEITQCHCVELVEGKLNLVQDSLRITQNGMAGVVLENTSETELRNVCLYYKLYVNAQDMYVGGVTYRYPVGTLLPGQRLEVIPEHFVWGYSAIVDVTTGEE